MEIRQPLKMRAVLLTDFGGPEKLVESMVDIPKPGVGEVLIAVGACGVNNTDIWLREGGYGNEIESNLFSNWLGRRPNFPLIQGSDVVGRIEEVGPQVDSSEIGKRVIVNPTLYTRADGSPVDAGFLGSERPGGFAQYIVIPVENAYPIHSSLSDPQLATFPCAYLTAEHMLNRVHLKKDEIILVTGASGGVGSALIQLSLLRGGWTIAIVSKAKKKQAMELGAHSVVIRRNNDLTKAINDALNGRDLDVVADVVGGASLTGILKLLRPGGRLVIAGAIAGPTIKLDLRTIYLKHLEIIGSTLGTKDEFHTIVRYIESQKIKPLLAKTYSLSNIPQAQDDFKKKKFFGKLVIVPSEL